MHADVSGVNNATMLRELRRARARAEKLEMELAPLTDLHESMVPDGAKLGRGEFAKRVIVWYQRQHQQTLTALRETEERMRQFGCPA